MRIVPAQGSVPSLGRWGTRWRSAPVGVTFRPMTEPQKQSKSTGIHPKTGKPMPKGGRKAGVPNKSTVSFRETITRLLESNAENIALWVEQVANGTDAVYDRKGNLLKPGRPPDPAGALTRLGHLADFAAPRLSRQETVGDGGGPITVVIRKESET